MNEAHSTIEASIVIWTKNILNQTQTKLMLYMINKISGKMVATRSFRPNSPPISTSEAVDLTLIEYKSKWLCWLQ